MRFPVHLLGLATAAALLAVLAADTAAVNALSDAEKAEGWQLLFDGKTTAGWRGFKKAGFPALGWSVVDGCLTHPSRGGGGDIITEQTFDEFELRFEWRMAANGNSGVKYFLTEDRGGAIGHEYQLLTGREVDSVQRPSKGGTGGFYDVLPPEIPIQLRPADQFNESRILVRGNQVEHWLNGQRTVAYELGSPAVMAAVANSKFKDVQGFGTRVRGHILLQDHGGAIWFRNLKIRPGGGATAARADGA
jgi:hypothetical protein